MSDYEEDWDMDAPVKQKGSRTMKEVRDKTNKEIGRLNKSAAVKMKLGGSINGTFDSANPSFKTEKLPVEYKDVPASLKKLQQKEILEHRKRNMTRENYQDLIVSESDTNKFIIYKFMKKGFTALTAEELAQSMMNPTFTKDFKENTGEDWNKNYQAKVVAKLQKSKLSMNWLNKPTQGKSDDRHQTFLKLIEQSGDIR